MNKHGQAHIVFDVPTVKGVLGSFALDVGLVTQVLDVDLVVPVPLAPGAVRGIMNHNGRIVTVIDPAPLLGFPEQNFGMAQCLLLRRDNRRKGNLGLLVQRIREIIPRAVMQPVDLPAANGISWVAHVRQQFIHVIDLEPLLQGLSEQFGPSEQGEPLAGVGL